MRPASGLLIAALVLACSQSGTSDAPVSFDADRAEVHRAAASALTKPTQASPVSAVAQFLRERGASEATVASLRAKGQNRNARTGITHVRVEQEVGGLRIHGAYLKAAVNDRGELVHLVANHAAVATTRPTAARATEADALRAALALHHPSVAAPAAGRRQGNVTTFEKTAFFHEAPTVERVAILMKSGELREGYLVETWSDAGNLLHHTTVDGDGKVVGSELRTSNDSYNIFPVHPDVTPQQIVAGPGAGNAFSPLGWLFAGTHRTIDIAGNNVHAYLDAVPDGAPDAGGVAVADGNFVTVADLTVSPSVAANQAVAIQNLFYLNNVIHDTLYQAGFTEEAGNFQEENFGKGGHGRDSVQAEGQDGGGIDNANFATPTDGRRPRMQMYLWTGKGNHQLVVAAPASIAGTYRAQGAAFGGTLDATGITADLVVGTYVLNGQTLTDGCQPLTNDVAGAIVLVDRGTCTFTVKVKNAQDAGAVAAVVANNANGTSIITMGGADPTITIAAIFIGQNDGATIKAGLQGVARDLTEATARLTDPPPLQRDGDLDSDIVWHEYGHGLTWRMIGQMQGPLAGAVGEGMADVLAIVINDDDVVGEYSFDDPIGIRRFRYQGYPLHYGFVQGTEVHNDGEIYAAIGWRLWKSFQAAGIGKDVLLAYLVDGMNFTPGSPAFEDMRDGILAAIGTSGHPDSAAHACLVWQAFAFYGVGEGADANYAAGIGLPGSGGPAVDPNLRNVRVTTSFVVPAGACPSP